MYMNMDFPGLVQVLQLKMAGLSLFCLFLHSHEAHSYMGLLKKNEKKLARSFNFMLRYIELNNSRFW